MKIKEKCIEEQIEDAIDGLTKWINNQNNQYKFSEKSINYTKSFWRNLLTKGAYKQFKPILLEIIKDHNKGFTRKYVVGSKAYNKRIKPHLALSYEDFILTDKYNLDNMSEEEFNEFLDNI